MEESHHRQKDWIGNDVEIRENVTCPDLDGWHMGGQARNPEKMKLKDNQGWRGQGSVFSVKYEYHLEDSWRIVRKQVE